jgi:hypothetical protein
MRPNQCRFALSRGRVNPEYRFRTHLSALQRDARTAARAPEGAIFFWGEAASRATRSGATVPRISTGWWVLAPARNARGCREGRPAGSPAAAVSLSDRDNHRRLGIGHDAWESQQWAHEAGAN